VVLGLVFSLVVVVIQDLNYRKIHVVLPVLVFLFSIVLFNRKLELKSAIYITNIVFFLLIIGVLVLYMSVKNKKLLNPFDHYFGLGDLLFFLGITPLFLTYNFVLFFILSMVFSIVLQLMIQNKKEDKTIPLAGYSALLLLLFIGKDLLLHYNKITIL
jgi:peptidoglycan/LPS O-acetylase OafA/YrhL